MGVGFSATGAARLRRGASLRFSALSRFVAACGATIALTALSAAAQTASPITIQLDESQPTSAFSVTSAFNPGGCSLATPGPNVTFGPAGPTSFAIDGGVLTAGTIGTNITYASNRGLFNTAGTAVPLSFRYDCPSATAAYADTILTVSVPVFAPGTTVVNTSENIPVTISAGQLGPNRTFDGVTITAAPRGGTAVASGTSITYTPSNSFVGTDTLQYVIEQTVNGTTYKSQAGTLNIAVAQIAPTAASITVPATENTPVQINLAGPNTIGEPYTISLPAARSVQGGSLALSGGIATYTPASNFSGIDSFEYRLTNAAGTATGSVAVTVVQAGKAPGPKAFSFNIDGDQPVDVDVTQGATGGPFAFATIVQAPTPAQGTSILRGNTVIVFTPAAGFVGTATTLFTLTNTAGLTSSPATITVTVSRRPNPAADPTVVALLNAQLETARRFYTEQLRNFEQRIEDIHRQTHGFTISGFSLTSGNQPAPGTSPANPAGATSGAAGGSTGSGSAPLVGGGASADNSEIELPDRWGGFLNGVVNFGQKNGTSYRDGFGFNTQGVSAGVDYRLTSWAVLGAGAGFSADDDSIGGNGSDSNARGVNVTLYGTLDVTDQIYVDGIVTYGSLQFDSKRYAPLTGLFTQGHRGGDQLYGSVTGGYEFSRNSLSVAPYLRLNAAAATLNRFTETGGGFAALSYGAQNLNDLSTTIGIRGDYAYSLEDSILSPHFRLEYNHEFLGSNQTNLLYADTPLGAGYRFSSDPVDRNYFTVAVGTNWLMENALSLFVDYEALLAYRGEQSQTFTFGVSKRF